MCPRRRSRVSDPCARSAAAPPLLSRPATPRPAPPSLCPGLLHSARPSPAAGAHTPAPSPRSCPRRAANGALPDPASPPGQPGLSRWVGCGGAADRGRGLGTPPGSCGPSPEAPGVGPVIPGGPQQRHPRGPGEAGSELCAWGGARAGADGRDLGQRERNATSQGLLPGELVLAWRSGPPPAGSPAAGGRRLGSRPGAVPFLCKSSAVAGGLGPAAARSPAHPPCGPRRSCRDRRGVERGARSLRSSQTLPPPPVSFLKLQTCPEPHRVCTAVQGSRDPGWRGAAGSRAPGSCPGDASQAGGRGVAGRDHTQVETRGTGKDRSHSNSE